MTIYRVYFPLRNTILNLIDKNEKLFETYIYCPSYISRSGLTYEMCFEFNEQKNDWVEKRGLVPISKELFTYVREGLWHYAEGKLPPKEFRDWKEELKVADEFLSVYSNDELRYLIIRIANGFTVYIKRYYDIEKLVVAEELVRQGNLVIYRVEPFRKSLVKKVKQLAIHKSTYNMIISSHIITNASFTIVAERETPRIQAKLMYMRRIWSATGRYLPLILLHPEHEKVEVEEFEPGLYLIMHLRGWGVE